jgi:hypothetical protein
MISMRLLILNNLILNNFAHDWVEGWRSRQPAGGSGGIDHPRQLVRSAAIFTGTR